MVNLLDVYKPLFTTDKRYILITGGRGSAKSFHVTSFNTLLTYELNHRILFTRYTLTSAAISIIPEFTEKIDLIETPHHFDVQNNYIQNLQTGSDVIFKGIKTSSGNQTANLKSLQGVSTWTLDEAEELISEETFDTIDLSIRKNDVQNRVILVMNPTTKEHFVWNRFFEGHLSYKEIDGCQVPISTHPDLCHIHTTYLDNIENLPETYIQQIERLKETNFEKYRHKIIGGWLEKAEGVIFENWEEGEFDNTLPYAFGQDFGFSVDPTTLIKVAVDNDNRLIYIDEYYYKSSPLGTKDIVQLDRSLIDTPEDLIVADAHGQQNRIVHDLRQEGLNVIGNTRNNVKADITKALDYKMIVTPRSQNVKKELNNYAWNDKKAGIPIDDHNHTIDAILYAFTQLSRPQMYFG